MGFADGLRAILGARGNVPAHPIKTGTGFAVSGWRGALAIGNPWMETTLLTPGEEEAGQPLHSVPAIIQVEARKARAGSVAIQFADGSGTVIAAIDGYVGTVVVDGGGVTNVSYVRSQENGLWPDYERKRARLDQLRATVGTAARFGVFRIEGERETRTKRARQLGDAIRILNDIDATLGLYAAYAYADADLSDEVRSVRSLMHQTLNADLFDVAMLSGILSGKRSDDGDDPVPFCPMLSQGWNLLRVKDVRLLPEIEEARYHLRPALWTTFDPEGMRIILKALRSGRLR